MSQLLQPNDPLPIPASGGDLGPTGWVPRPAFADACRAASLRLSGPTLARLGVTSAVRGEGRTEVALTLAGIQAGDYGRSTLLLDLDFARPSLARLVGVSETPGIAEFLRGEAALEAVTRRIEPGLELLPAGDPGPLLDRSAADFVRGGLLSILSSRADVLVADLGPLLEPVGRATAVAFPELLMVVAAGRTPIASVREAVDGLEHPPKVVLTRVRSSIPGWFSRLTGV